MNSTHVSPPERSLYSIAAEMVDSKEEVDTVIAAYARNVRAGRERAAKRSAAQYLVGVSSPDRPGIIADVCRNLAEWNFNIDQARTVVAARCILFHLLATAPVSSKGESAMIAAGLGAALADSDVLSDGRAYVDPLPQQAPILLFDHTKSYHLTAEVGERPGVLTHLTRIVADNNGAILALSSWLVKENEGVKRVIDMHLGVPPSQAESLQKGLAEAEQHLGEPINLTHGDKIVSRAVRTSLGRDRVIALTVSGHARPGFVFRVLKEVEDRSVVVSSMVVFDAYTFLIVLIDLPPEERYADTLKETLGERLAEWGRECGEAVPFTIHTSLITAPERENAAWYGPPTHYVRCVGASDEKGVIAEIAAPFARRKINIIGLDANIRGDVSSDLAPFEVQVQVNIPVVQDEQDVRAEVESLAKQHNWACSFNRLDGREGASG